MIGRLPVIREKIRISDRIYITALKMEPTSPKHKTLGEEVSHQQTII